MRARFDPASNQGTTLWELLCAMAVLATLVAIGVPAMQKLVLDARRASSLGAFFDSIQLARSEAAARGAQVVLCQSVDGSGCAGPDSGFDEGWIVFVNTDGDHPPARGDAEALIRTHRPSMKGTIRANREHFVFRPLHTRSTNGTVTFCDARGAAEARAVIVSFTGRPRISGTGPGGRELGCP